MNMLVKVVCSIALTAAAGGRIDRAAAQAAAAEALRPPAEAPADAKATPCEKGASPTPATSVSTEDSPRWVCPEQAITVASVWHGQKIECPFTIRNEGKSNLHIRASGG